MATIKHTLQKEVFQPLDERLIGVVHVTKANKKKKTVFLCLVITTDKPVYATLYQVKRTEKESYKKKTGWPLRELKTVDGKDASQDTAEFELHLDRIYRWTASSLQEKYTFINILWKLSCRYLPKQMPNFVNIPQNLLEERPTSPHLRATGADDPVEETGEVEDYHALSEREERDLEALMSQCEYAVSDAQAFTDGLSRELNVLDGANINSLLASEAAVSKLMGLLEKAEGEVTKLEDRLNSYDGVMSGVRDALEEMKEKNQRLAMRHTNNNLLLKQLDDVISQLDISPEHQSILMEPDFSNPEALKASLEAAEALRNAINTQNVHPSLLKLTAVQDQRKQFHKWKGKFSNTLSRHVNNLFLRVSNDMNMVPSDTEDSISMKLTSHEAIHLQIRQYRELMHWLKMVDSASFLQLTKVYTDAMNSLYTRQLQRFFEAAKIAMLAPTSARKSRYGGGAGDSGTLKAGARLRAGSSSLHPSHSSASLLGNEVENWGSENESTGRQTLEGILEKVLAELEPFYLAEQRFCVDFFQPHIAAPDQDESVSAQKKSGKQATQDIRRLMADIFTCLEGELTSLLHHYEGADTFACVSALVKLSSHVLSAEDAGSHLRVSYGTLLVTSKRSFDKFMQGHLKSIEDSKPPRKAKWNIIPFVENFQGFATTIEAIYQAVERRADLDKWYTRLVHAMFESINRVACEFQRAPTEAVKMENYHSLQGTLATLKLSVLENERKEAKKLYQEALQAYVKQYFGRPLEKVNVFFEGVEAKLASGIKETEVGYQLAFSKNELRRLIQQYPASSVKKGLSELYRKVEKHLSEDSPLLQVVWHTMEQEFLRQYKSLEDLIARCYPGSGIQLDFSIDTLLTFFSDIARSH